MSAPPASSPDPAAAHSPIDGARAVPPALWDKLLDLIEEGKVVPVVGEGLLRVTVGGRDIPLMEYLAARLAVRLNVEVAGGSAPARRPSLSDVASRYIRQNRRAEMSDISAALNTIWREDMQQGVLRVPQALTDLASISAFKLFVTTTFDPLLQQALSRRQDGPAKVLVYGPGGFKDLEHDVDDLMSPAVFHLLGRLSTAPEYAVTEEDALEFFHSLQAQVREPGRLFGELRRRYLLVLGSRFSDWLFRFFLRLAKPERLWTSRSKTDYLIDDDPGSAELVTFLESFSVGTNVVSTDPIAFVATLAAKWAERRAAQSPGGAAPSWQASPVTQGFRRGSVFLSYASDDLAVAQSLRDQLDRVGIDVWFDKGELSVGQRWEREIKLAIQDSALFIAVLSRNSLTPRRRYFRAEWNVAFDENVQAPPSRPFILPIAIDDAVSETHPDLAAFRDLQWHRLPAGMLPGELIERVKKAVRAFHEERGL